MFPRDVILYHPINHPFCDSCHPINKEAQPHPRVPACLGVALLESVELDGGGAVDLDLLDVGGPLLPLDGNLVAPEPVAVERREAARVAAQFRVCRPRILVENENALTCLT